MSPPESPRTLPLRNLLLPQMSDAKPVGTPPCLETPPPVNREEPVAVPREGAALCQQGPAELQPAQPVSAHLPEGPKYQRALHQVPAGPWPTVGAVPNSGCSVTKLGPSQGLQLRTHPWLPLEWGIPSRPASGFPTCRVRV